jgi:hypothetical protein
MQSWENFITIFSAPLATLFCLKNTGLCMKTCYHIHHNPQKDGATFVRFKFPVFLLLFNLSELTSVCLDAQHSSCLQTHRLPTSINKHKLKAYKSGMAQKLDPSAPSS